MKRNSVIQRSLVLERNWVNAFALLLFFAFLQSCTTAGNPAIKDENRESIASKLLEGSTTKNEVNSMLGDPMETDFIADGQEVWTYELSKIKPLVRNFIPYVAIFSSGSDGVQQKLTILFDENDVVDEYRWNESKIQRRTGILVNTN